VSEIIQLTDTARLRVEVDEDASNPRKDWSMMTGFANIPDLGDSRIIDVEPVHADTYGLAEAHGRMDAGRYAYRATIVAPDGTKGGWIVEKISRTPVEDRVIRWARIFRGVHVEYDSEHGGYWFVDPQQVQENWPGSDYPDGKSKAEWEAAIIKGERETYRQWAEGEVYGVILERLVTWARMLDDGTADRLDTRDEWEEVESVWGCYLDDTYTAQDVANESWELTDEESAALGLDAPVG
jgi:hypothetical protein